ncbi:unnamed protein product [Brassica napus]|uniref:(rape) hypothetical protein n=1 Tax=Brassica napus TaxID=3708 RepID=A0A816TKJ5_BRANA|nr:unnamed protein product [Brassica napus]
MEACMVRYTFSLLIREYTDCSFGKRNPNSLHSSQPVRLCSQHEEFSHYTENIPYINLWIKCAMSHNVENLSLQIWNQYYEYKLPDFFCNSSSLSNSTSLLIQFFRLSNESMAKILSGCPIVAPNIHCLRLFNSQLSYPLPDVASLTEAELEICFVSMDSQFEADFLQVWVLEMLEKLQNADKLNFGRNFVQILSIAEIRGAHFPLLKVKAMTLDTKIFQYVIPGIERLLQR